MAEALGILGGKKDLALVLSVVRSDWQLDATSLTLKQAMQIFRDFTCHDKSFDEVAAHVLRQTRTKRKPGIKLNKQYFDSALLQFKRLDEGRKLAVRAERSAIEEYAAMPLTVKINEVTGPDFSLIRRVLDQAYSILMIRFDGMVQEYRNELETLSNCSSDTAPQKFMAQVDGHLCAYSPRTAEDFRIIVAFAKEEIKKHGERTVDQRRRLVVNKKGTCCPWNPAITELKYKLIDRLNKQHWPGPSSDMSDSPGGTKRGHLDDVKKRRTGKRARQAPAHHKEYEECPDLRRSAYSAAPQYRAA